MPDPKAGLTKFSTVLAVAADLGAIAPQLGAEPLGAGEPGLERIARVAPEIGRRYAQRATRVAASGTVTGVETASLADLQSRFSISTVEELVALAVVDDRQRSDLVGKTGIPKAQVDEMLGAYRAHDGGRAEVEDWARYERFRYQTGCAIAEVEPGPDGGPIDFGAAPLPPPGFTGKSLIDVHMSRIRDQGARGTCTAFAGIACLEYHERSTGTHPRADLSEQFAYWDMIDQTGMHALGPMFTLLRDTGACTERTWPYNPAEMQDDDGQGPPPLHAIQKAQGYRATTVLQLAARSVSAIRAAIGADHVVAIGIPVYASWYQSPVVRKYGNITVPLPGENREPIGHAIALVGYEDDSDYAGGGYFIVRNSWDSNWATESVFGPGYGTIPYRYISDFNMDAWYVAA